MKAAPPRGIKEAVADVSPPRKKKAWSKPTIRVVDGMLETESGPSPGTIGEVGNYRPTS